MSLIISTRYGKRDQTQSMARRPRGREKIQMNSKRFGYFPKQFTWRSRRYVVYGIDRCWTVSRKRFGSKMNRLCFRVRCAASGSMGVQTNSAVLEGTFEIHQDLDTNTWYFEKMVSRT
jgi:hypothetical protein